MKKFLTFSLICAIAFAIPTTTAYASSLEDVLSQNQPTTEVSTDTVVTPEPSGSSDVAVSGDPYLDEIKGAADLSELSPGATKINDGVKKAASFLVQVLSYFITALLVLRVLIDLCYILLPFSRLFLANGYQGNVQAGVGMADDGMGMGMGGMQGGMGGMGGMGSPMGGFGGGFGGGGFGGMGGMSGMGGGMYGRGRYGMRGGMGMGMGGMQNGMQQQQQMQGANPLHGRIQLVSSQALNAVAAESSGGYDGKPDSPLKVYAKDMIITLVAAPVFLVLAITGVLTDLGFLIGDILVDAIRNLGNMI